MYQIRAVCQFNPSLPWQQHRFDLCFGLVSDSVKFGFVSLSFRFRFGFGYISIFDAGVGFDVQIDLVLASVLFLALFSVVSGLVQLGFVLVFVSV